MQGWGKLNEQQLINWLVAITVHEHTYQDFDFYRSDRREIAAALAQIKGGKVSWTVVDTHSVDVSGKCQTVGRFDSEESGSAFIASLPEAETGRYGLDEIEEAK